jgi:4-hydroxy-3-polyprenylbenzoate decarboxylase
MAYRSLEECLLHLERMDIWFRIKEQVDPYLEMAAIHLRVHESNGPAMLFEQVKGFVIQQHTNIFGTLERSKFIFDARMENFCVQLIELRGKFLRMRSNHPVRSLRTDRVK